MKELLAQLKQRWMDLDANDRSALQLGGVAISLMLAFVVIVLPIYHSYSKLRQNLPQQRNALVTMQAQALEAKRLNSNPSAKPVNESLLSLLEKSTTLHDIKKNVQSLTPQSDRTAAIRLKSVEYTRLIKWLAGLSSQYQLKAKEAELTHAEGQGLVDAYLVFQGTGDGIS